MTRIRGPEVVAPGLLTFTPVPKRILVPLDLSPEAESVLPVVADAARGSGATVRFIHVAPVPESVEGVDGHVIAFADQETARLEAEGTDYLRTAARLAGIAADAVVRFGEPAREIAREAETFGADLIVLATRHGGPLSRLILGSTSEQICRRTHVPVLVYRPGAQ
jgi:nucleotide-binding universal stress UspA family protein